MSPEDIGRKIVGPVLLITAIAVIIALAVSFISRLFA